MNATPEQNTNLGQHFLLDKTIADATVDLVPEGSLVVEIGAGAGALTRPLLEKVGDHGKVVAFEFDARFKDTLLDLPHQDRFELRLGDFIAARIPEAEADHEGLHVVGNVPYHILEPLLRKLAQAPMKQAVLMVPNDFRERATAEHPGNSAWTQTSMETKAYFTTKIIAEAPREAFDPAPPVDSAVIRLKPRKGPEQGADGAIADIYRKVLGSLENNATVLSILRNTTLQPGGDVAGSGQRDHKRHRGERRTRRQSLKDMAFEYNATGVVSTETIRASVDEDFASLVLNSSSRLNEADLNMPLNAMNNTTIRRMCEAIEGQIKARKARK